MSPTVPDHVPDRAVLQQLITTLEDQQLVHGNDFAIAYLTEQVLHQTHPDHTVSINGEILILDFTPDGCRVLYRDMGRYRTLGQRLPFTQAAELLREETAWLAAGRLHGPYTGRTRPVRAPDQTPAQLTAAYDTEVQDILATYPPDTNP